MKHAMRHTAPTHEANAGKLIRERLDLLRIDRRPRRYRPDRWGNQIQEAPLILVRQPYYLALRTGTGTGMDLLTARFSAELKRFKQEARYQQLLDCYSRADAANTPTPAPP